MPDPAGRSPGGPITRRSADNPLQTRAIGVLL